VNELHRVPIAAVEGLGPHGESAASVDQLRVSEVEAARARAARFTVAVVIHTTGSDWSRQQLAGITDTLGRYGADLVEVIDCGFRARNQVDALEHLIGRRPDAIISLPVDNLRTAEAHRKVTDAGIKLVLMDNAPIGLIAGKDYVTVISADNFGNGRVAAAIIAPRVGERGSVGIVGFGVDFFVTNEREIGFRKWMRERRPDVTLRLAEFLDLETAGEAAIELLGREPAMDALFVAWDEPAVRVVRALRAIGRDVPVVTIDLGNEMALEIARGGPVVGVGAQMPYDLGVAEATATIMALVGAEPPPWVALPALSVTRRNVVEAYETVWHQAAPAALRLAADASEPQR
jgi:ribose transport system substrate-binding protein